MDKNNHDLIIEKESEESFESLLRRSVVPSFHINPGQMIETVVIKISKDWVFIDSGGKSEGHIEIDEFKDEDGNITINEGDSIRAYFLSSRNNERLFTTKLTIDKTDKDLLEEAYHNRIPIEGVVEKEIKGGFEIRIAGNVRAFCPYSQMGPHQVTDSEKYIGKQLTFRIIEYGKKGRNLIISNKAAIEEERRKQRDALRESLKEGMTVSGEITSIRKFGAFVDVGGIEGLIPVSEISWDRVEDIRSVLSIGQKVDVYISKLDWDNDKFSFSLKEILPDPWTDIAHRYPEGSSHLGKVSRLTSFGAFVTLEPGVEGLLHISELGKGKRINRPHEVLEVNQVIQIRISRVDEGRKRISLSILSNDEESGQEDDYKRRLTEGGKGFSSGSFGMLGDLLKAKIEK
ncbi:MAG: 30S ribosomal protein S1 [Deltaproteobacteria bacterium RBG_19FT_COMBO_46_9]|nr:MAG: 30S ribosomal protein S1 [Deltaproteobacteria bacterium RBG_19FT_COMBO_46_9]